VFAAMLAGCAKVPVERVEWTVMGTIAGFACRDAADLGRSEEVISVFGDVERLLNAHDLESELSRLAPLSDDEVLERCDPRMRPCYEAAFRLMCESGGAFNPRWRGPATLDLGGIAKGFAADLAAERIGACDALIDLGGNLKACGGEWRVGIYSPADSSPAGQLRLAASGACATSGEYARGKHIYDGRTGLAVTNDVLSVTVVHPTSAMLADGLSTILFIFGREDGDAFLAAHHPEARAIWQMRPSVP
jgi:thiamine biosynthesis lipoprotein